MDDAFGAIVYISKEKGHVDPGPAFTVHLEVDYKNPVPAGNAICCTTEISRIEGRKIFGSATVQVSHHNESAGVMTQYALHTEMHTSWLSFSGSIIQGHVLTGSHCGYFYMFANTSACTIHRCTSVLQDKPGGTTYASGSAIFVNPKPKSAAALSGLHGGPQMKATTGTAAEAPSNGNEASKADANGKP